MKIYTGFLWRNRGGICIENVMLKYSILNSTGAANFAASVVLYTQKYFLFTIIILSISFLSFFLLSSSFAAICLDFDGYRECTKQNSVVA